MPIPCCQHSLQRVVEWSTSYLLDYHSRVVLSNSCCFTRSSRVRLFYVFVFQTFPFACHVFVVTFSLRFRFTAAAASHFPQSLFHPKLHAIYSLSPLPRNSFHWTPPCRVPTSQTSPTESTNTTSSIRRFPSTWRALLSATA